MKALLAIWSLSQLLNSALAARKQPEIMCVNVAGLQENFPFYIVFLYYKVFFFSPLPTPNHLKKTHSEPVRHMKTRDG